LKQIKNDFPDIEIFAGDLTDKNSLDELVLFIEQRHPGLNILINNAVVQYNYNFTDEPNLTDKIDDEVSAEITAPIKLTGLLLLLLLKNKNSAAVNVSSGLFIAPKIRPGLLCYKLTDEFFKNFEVNKFESYMGKTKLLKFINRLSPELADKIMKNGV